MTTNDYKRIAAKAVIPRDSRGYKVGFIMLGTQIHTLSLTAQILSAYIVS